MKSFIYNPLQRKPMFQIQLENEFNWIFRSFQISYETAPSGFNDFVDSKITSIHLQIFSLLFNSISNPQVKEIIKSHYQTPKKNNFSESIRNFSNEIETSILKIKNFCEQQDSPESMYHNRKDFIKNVTKNLLVVGLGIAVGAAVLKSEWFGIMAAGATIIPLGISMLTPQGILSYSTGLVVLSLSSVALIPIVIGAATSALSYCILRGSYQSEKEIFKVINESSDRVFKFSEIVVLNADTITKSLNLTNDNLNYEIQL